MEDRNSHRSFIVNTIDIPPDGYDTPRTHALHALQGDIAASASNATESPFENAEVIAELIESLRTADIDTERDQSHFRHSSVYSFDPLHDSDLGGMTPRPRSFQMTPAESRRSSRRSSRAPKSNVDSAISLPKSKHQSAMSNLQRDPEAASPIEPDQGSHPGPEPPHSQPEPQYPAPARLALILISLYIGIFLVALDRTILGPAIPEITNQFNSIGDIGWYGSAYMLTSCGFILIYGRVYTFFATKWVFLISIAIFEIGSAVCGAASSSLILIIGRAVAGFGSSGIFTGAILIILEIVPLHRRPLLQGLFGACFGVASVAGPLLGGVFTGSKLTWRWCFYINLPLGGVTILVVLLFLHLDQNKKRNGWKDTFIKLDPIGTILFLPSITCLLLALEWGATESWHTPRIIALLTVFAVLFVAFIAWQGYTRNTTATVPARIAFQRSVAFGGLSQFAVGATMLTVSLYIPLWFQAIKDVSAMQSGIRTIPLVLSVVVGSIFSGGAVQKLGYYTPFMIIGAVLMSVGAGLLTTWTMSISNGIWIGYQIILGLGVGFTMQHPNLAIQIVLPKPDIPTGTALLSLCQTLGGAVFTAVGQNTFIDKFLEGIRKIGHVNPDVVHAGATELKNVVPPPLQGRVLAAYNHALTQGPFFACLIIACFALPAALGMEWRSVKEGQQRPPQGPPPPSRDEETPRESQSPESREAQKGDDMEMLPLPPPLRDSPHRRSWRESYRMVGDYSWVLVKRLNPDLRKEMDSRPPGRS